MTCQEIGEYCNEMSRRDKDLLMSGSSVGYRLIGVLTNLFSKHPKNLTFDNLFPEFKSGEDSKEKEIENKWREFLGR